MPSPGASTERNRRRLNHPARESRGGGEQRDAFMPSTTEVLNFCNKYIVHHDGIITMNLTAIAAPYELGVGSQWKYCIASCRGGDAHSGVRGPCWAAGCALSPLEGIVRILNLGTSNFQTDKAFMRGALTALGHFDFIFSLKD